MRLISKKTLLLFFLPGAVFMGAFLVYPILSMVFDSFFEIGITGDRTFIGLDNYIHAFTAGGFLKQLKNTLIYIVVAVSIETILGVLFALFFEMNYKGEQGNTVTDDGAADDCPAGGRSYMETDDELQFRYCK